MTRTSLTVGLLWFGRVVVMVAALALCAWWVHGARVANRGAVLVEFSPTHGIDVSDLLIIPFLSLMGWLVWPRRRARR